VISGGNHFLYNSILPPHIIHAVEAKLCSSLELQLQYIDMNNIRISISMLAKNKRTLT